MAILRTVRKAVKKHICDWCGKDVEPGERYIRSFMTPGHMGRDQAGHTLKKCGSCGRYSPLLADA